MIKLKGILSEYTVGATPLPDKPEKGHYLRDGKTLFGKILRLDKDYKGHYVMTPYSFSPAVGVKLVNNPSVDFGQGILECLETLHKEIIDSIIKDYCALKRPFNFVDNPIFLVITYRYKL